jgi:hypothetical protein
VKKKTEDGRRMTKGGRKKGRNGTMLDTGYSMFE